MAGLRLFGMFGYARSRLDYGCLAGLVRPGYGWTAAVWYVCLDQVNVELQLFGLTSYAASRLDFGCLACLDTIGHGLTADFGCLACLVRPGQGLPATVWYVKLCHVMTGLRLFGLLI